MSKALQFSNRIQDLHSSPIRDILSIIDREGMISFAGGLPSPDSFPFLSCEQIPNHIMQYGPSEGESALRKRIAEELESIGLCCKPDQILILSGSQQGIDLVSKLFIDSGTCIALEVPTYLAALQVFRFFGAQFTTLDPQQPEHLLRIPQRPAFVYTIPTFQNPTGYCYSHEERQSLASLCDEANIPIFEDDPYRDLVYDSCIRTPICSYLKRASWMYQGSFSKSLAPGLRLGFMAVSSNLISYFTSLKQAADLHSSRISQWLVLNQLNSISREKRTTELINHYRCKRDAFEHYLQRYFNDIASWQTPAGGLFYWLQLKKPQDTRRLLPLAIDQNVAFMPGEPFFPPVIETSQNPNLGTLRLNFSHASDSEAERGLSKLASLIR
ncbi:MAG: PLP-dependent aminotransferase family protein [Pseudomonadota bacterium]